MSSETKSSSEQPFALQKTSISTEAVSCIVGNRNSRRSSPRESARGSQPSRTPSPEGGEGSGAPHARAVGNNIFKRTTCFVGNQYPHQNTPGRAREGVNPLDFQSRPATCAAERLLAQRASKRFATDQAKSKISVGRPRALISSEWGLAPGEKIASLQMPRPEIQRISAESEKGWYGGESVPAASGCAREGRSPLDFQSSRGWQWRGSLLPRPPHKPAPPSTSRASASISLYTLDSTSTSAEKSIRGMYLASVSSCSAFAARRQP